MLCYFYARDEWLDFCRVPFLMYAAVNATLFVAAICFYLGIFRVRQRNISRDSRTTNILNFLISQLSNLFTIVGLLLTLFVLHALFAIYLIIYTHGEEKKKIEQLSFADASYPKSSLRTVLFPGLWFCMFSINRRYRLEVPLTYPSVVHTGAWAFVFARMTYFFITMQDFKSHPTFVRNSVHLIRALSSVTRDRSRSA